MAITPVCGDILKLDSLKPMVKKVDAVIYSAMPGVFGDETSVFEHDYLAVETIITAMRGTNKTFIYSSGAMVLADLQTIGGEGTALAEDHVAKAPPTFIAKRVQTENLVLNAAKNGIRTIVIRIPHPYGKGGNFILPFLIGEALQHNKLFYINNGDNMLSFVHVQDLAELYWLALEKSAAGELYHPSSFQMKVKDLVMMINKKMAIKRTVASINFAHAKQLWGETVSLVIGVNGNLNSDKARELLGWIPSHHSIEEEIVTIISRS